MAGNASEESAAGRSLEGMSNGQRYQSGDALVEWRSSEQVENGTPSTSPPYWDTDDSDDDGGPKPMNLFGKFTWKIEKFSQVNKRELRSNPFEIGGYKWYILIYPQGCDVCNHLSLFLCVANHDKLLPGWSHFAQFTIAVVNKDPKKSKYSDTLHRFWKKEHDWGWKKFMELSKVSDGFLDSDALVIKAQVQVIREKADRPFRCLDCQYRRELVRVYLTNVEQICRRFVEERRTKLEKLIDDKARWSSFCAFWLGIDQNARRRMSREKMDMILKIIVKHFFIEKEVTSTLVMDSLYSGLKALEGQSKCKKGKGKLMDGEDAPAPIVRVEKDVFVLVDDVLLLLKRAALEPLPPKDEKGPQNRTKEGGTGEDSSKDTIERDEIRLTELGRRTVEIFVLAHIFSNTIEVAYQEAVALKRQEELIREEEAAWLAESEQKAKRGVSEREKKSKKKQGKQKRNNRKGKDKVKDEKSNGALQDKRQPEVATNQEKDMVQTQAMVEKEDALEDASDVSDSVEFATDMLHADSEDREASPVNWDTDTSEVHPPGDSGCSEISSSLSTVQTRGFDKRSSPVIDDSSSTCSTDSTPSVVMNGLNRGNSSPSCKFQGSPTRGKNQRGKLTSVESSRPHGADSGCLTERIADVGHHNDYSPSYKVVGSNDSEGCATSLQDRTRWPELVKKEEEVVLLRRKPGNKDQTDVEKHSREKIRHSPRSPPKNTAQVVHLKSEPKTFNAPDVLSFRSSSSNSSQQTDRGFASLNASQPASVPRPDSVSAVVLKPTEKFSGQQAPVMSRPSSAPVIPATKPPAAVVSIVHSVPTTLPLSRSVSAAGRLGLDPPSAAHAPVPQSYRNAIIGSSNTGISHPPLSPTCVGSHPASSVINHAVNLGANASPTHSQQAALISASAYTPQVERLDTNGGNSGVSFGTPTQGVARSGHPWMENPQRDISRTMSFDSASSLNEIPSFELYRPVISRSPEFLAEFPVSTSGRHSQRYLGTEFSQSASVRHMATQSMMADEFPHLDIINELLDDEQGIGRNTECSFFPGLGSRAGLFSQRYNAVNEMGMPADVGSSTSSCRYDMSGGYHEDGLPRDYRSGSQFDAPREYIPQSNLMPYLNGQIDSMVPNQWQVAGPDLSLLNLRNSGGDGYLYNVPEYSNLACDMNGYAIFRPSNGH